ncbi:MAG: MFS transporter [Chlamydiia bacterium]|nr:MFS transporter [Chlamydiia bacterium]
MSAESQLIERPRPFYAWVVFILSVLFNAYTVTLQFSPSAEIIMIQDMGNAKEIVYALIAFYYTFALFQVPSGILIDRYGARIFPSIGVLLCAIGGIIMSQAEMSWHIAVARGIIGVGATFSFLNALKIINNWFQPKRFSYLLGLFIALVSLVVVLLKAAFLHLDQILTWRGAALSFGIGGLVFAGIYFFVMQDSPLSGSSRIPDRKAFWENIRSVFNTSHVWIAGMAVGLMIGPLFAFEAIWSIPFVQAAYKAPLSTAIMYNLLLMFGYAVGAVFFGRVSTSIRKRKIFIVWGIAVALMMLVIILYPPYLGIQVTSICFFVLGFAASNSNIGYTVVHEHNVPQVTATAIAVVNTFYALFAAISQTFISALLELNLHHPQAAATEQFQMSLIRLPIYLVIALVFSFFMKETYCNQRQTYDD